MSHWKGWGTSCASVAVPVGNQLIDRCVGALGGLGITGDCTHGCSDPTDPLSPSEGSVEVCPRSFAEQMGPACGAEVLRRDRLKKDISFCGNMKQGGAEKKHHDANNWNFHVCMACGAAPSSPSRRVLIVAAFAPWGKTWLVFDPSALRGGGPLCRDAAGLVVS